MKRSRNLLAAGLAVVLAACIAGYFVTGEPGTPKATDAGKAASRQSLVDQRLMQTANTTAALAGTADERELSREALRLADHELDQAFATALREAAESAPPPSVATAKLTDRIAQAKTKIAAEQQRIAKLTAQAAASDEAAGRLELAKAELALDQDDLADAQQDLAREGGDRRALLQRAMNEHEAAQHTAAAPAAANAVPLDGTLARALSAWLDLGTRGRALLSARQQATARADALSHTHDALEALANHQAAPAIQQDDSADADEEEDTSAVIARLHALSDQRKTLGELDQRIQDCRDLADVYGRWSASLETRRRAVLHALLRSLAGVLAILLVVVLIVRVIHHAFSGQEDRRRTYQMRRIGTICAQIAGLAAILLIVFGPPTQLSTMIGLMTAGLTVVLKDFIVAFFGWFVLMGRNGVRIGDWVEINGVGGEVIEIGLLKTVLLEMGNWTNTGHPTGRRVGFMNGYAIEGHYFNFSTAGQWLWDEIVVTVPLGGDPYRVAEEIRQMVERETAADAAEASHEWERVTHHYGSRALSAQPASNLRPGVNGLEVAVRYITRAPQRYEVKSRLFQAIVPLLHETAKA
jgi:small-conductance mechanosensitive channel